MTNIATEDCELLCSAIPPDPMKIRITTSPCDYVLINGEKVYSGPIEVLIPSGSTQGGGTLTESVTLKINPTIAQFTLVDGKKPICKGDNGVANGTFIVGQSSTTLPITCSIRDAGQSEVGTE